MSEVGKYGKSIGVPHPSDIRRMPAEPERATPRVKKRAEPKPFGIKYRYNSRWIFFSGRPHHKWFETKNSRDQSLHCMRREQHGGVDFYVDIEVIDP